MTPHPILPRRIPSPAHAGPVFRMRLVVNLPASGSGIGVRKPVALRLPFHVAVAKNHVGSLIVMIARPEPSRFMMYNFDTV